MTRQRTAPSRLGAMWSGGVLLLAICVLTWSGIALFRHYLHNEGAQLPRAVLASHFQPEAFGFTAAPTGALGDKLVVTSIRADGPADRAGLAIGDVIEDIDGMPADVLLDPSRQLRSKGGRPMDLQLVRDGAVRHLVLENSAD